MKIGITGCTGRIGALLITELQSGNWPNATLAGGSVRDLAKAPKDADYFITDNAEDLFARADTIIDFTSPAATLIHAKLAAKHQKILIAATSGLEETHMNALRTAAQSAPIIFAPNTSIGVNMLFALVEQAAARLNAADWDAEIIDAHHRFKKDAPGGSSFVLADAIREGRGQPDAKMTHERFGMTGPREEGSIGLSVRRGGDDVIENAVIFYGNGERVEIGHRATNRAIFAKGAIKAALWAKDKPAGFYTMRDVLEI